MTLRCLIILAIILPSILVAAPVSLSLSEAFALAERNDTGVESARIDIESGDALIKEATSGALPVVTFNASTGRFVIAPTTSIPAIGPGRIRFTPVNDASIGVSIAQPLWLGGRLGLALNAARVYTEISRVAMEVTRANLKKQIIKDYFQLALAREVLSVNEATYRQAVRHSLNASKMYDVGMISEFDLLRAQTGTMTLEPEVQRARQAVALAHTNLCNRLGLAEDLELILLDSLTYSIPTKSMLDNTDLYNQASVRRPEFRLIELQQDLGTIGLKAEERSLYWPNVFFNLGYQNQGQDDHYSDMSPSKWSTSLRWSVSMNIPLFNGFATDARVQKAKLGLRRTELNGKNLQNGVRMEIAAVITEYSRAVATVAGQAEALKMAERAYQISLIRYEQGLGTELDVQDIRLTVNRTKLGYLQGLFDMRVAEAEYARVIESDSELTSGK